MSQPSPATSHQPPATDELRALMWREVGLFRSRADLERAVSVLDAAYRGAGREVGPAGPHDPEAWKRFHLLTVARLMARAALRREESRGGHFRADFPERDDIHWKVHFTDRIDLHGQKR